MKTLITVLIVIGLIGFFAWSYIKKRRQEQAMATLALKNGWKALSTYDGTLASYLPDYLRNVAADSTNFDMAYAAKVAEQDLVFFQYAYTVVKREYNDQTHQEEERRKTYTFAVVAAQLRTSWPKILLLHHSLISKLTTLIDHFGLQQLGLEGNFNDQFDCYIAPGTQVQALSLLTPDVMELAQAWDKKASMQVNTTQLVGSIETTTFSPESIMPLLQNFAAVAAKINSKPVSEAKA